MAVDDQVMIAVQSGMVRKGAGGGRAIVKKGVTTAHAGADIVTRYPAMWAPIAVDFPAEGDVVDVSARAAGGPFFEALRRLAKGLEDRGFDLGATGADDVMVGERVVDVALALADYQTGRSEEPPAVRRDEVVEDELVVEDEVTVEQEAPVHADGEPAGPVHADPGTPEGRREIRAWAARQDIEVAPHGKIPDDVVDQYLAADLTDEADDGPQD